MVLNRSAWFLRHILFWVFVYLEEFLSLVGLGSLEVSISEVLASLLPDMALVYINLYILIPVFAMKGKLVKYLIFTAMTFITVIAINAYQMGLHLEESEMYPFYLRMYDVSLLTIGVLGPAIAFKLGKEYYVKNQRLNILREEKLETELEYLKKQINPHFLFNALNNIYTLSREKSNITPESILQLSDLLRYQTYETSKTKVPLLKEIEFLKNYLNLEKLRRENLEIKNELFFSDDLQSNQIMIEPMLFLPFIENACKFSNRIDGGKESVSTTWTCDGQQLTFKIVNNIGYENLSQEDSGFGLDNLHKRLDLLYPNQYNLSTNETSESYFVSLVLNL